MSLLAFISELKKKDINLQLKNDELKVHAPKGVLTGPIVADIRQRKTELITFLAQIEQAADDRIAPQTDRDTYPVSHHQRGLWILDKLGDPNGIYNMPSTFLVQGELHQEALVGALAQLSARHESLRTVFTEIDDEPVQRVLETCPPDFYFRDISGEPGPFEQARVLVNQDMNAPFDLETGPLCRAALLRLEPDCYLFLFNIHHIISDGWSMSVFWREFENLYNAAIDGSEAHLPLPAIQYRDFAAWHNQKLEANPAHKQYWSQKLAGALPVLDFPTDHPRPPRQTFAGSVVQGNLQVGLTAALNALALDHSVSMFMLLQSAIKVLLLKYSGCRDLIVGTVVSGRDHHQLEDQIGYFVNTLALRDQLAPTERFIQVLERVKQTTLEAFEHQAYPFNRVVEDVAPVRNISHAPLFDVLFVLQNQDRVVPQTHGLSWSPFEREYEISRNDLTFSLRETPEGIKLGLHYNTDLFEADTIKRLMTHFKVLLTEITAKPSAPLHYLSLLSAAEKQRILAVGDQSKTHRHPFGTTVVSLFEQQVSATPDAIALHDARTAMNYATLNQNANRLAHDLLARGVSAGQTVGLCVDYSIHMAIAIFGILKAGAAYLPMNGRQPAARIHYMLADSNAVCTVVSPGLASKIESDTQTINADGSRYTPNNPMLSIHPEGPAYTIYTSGSSGEPKGVVLRHRNILNYAVWRMEACRFTPADTTLQNVNVAFDGFGGSFYALLLSGGCLVLVDEAQALDFPHFCTLLKNHAATHLSTVPSMYHGVLESSGAGDLDGLRFVTLAGEKARKRLIRRSQRLFPHIQFNNEYGPTENSVATTAAFDMQADETAVIGRPIAGNRVYVLDETLQLVPEGIAGQLCVGGVGLASHYQGRPALTAGKFVPDPFSKAPAERLYQTGDRVRLLSDGRLEYLGRLDSQVKLRGFRIELGEIEARLMEHDDVSLALVKLHQDGVGKWLIAYLVVPEVAVRGAGLRDTLKEQLRTELPEYMLPAGYVFLDRIPLTSNGKLDVKALPAPDLAALASDQYVAPTNQNEQLLCQIWERVLKLDRVGIDDNFFELGGDSVLTIHVISRANAAGLALKSVQLFEHPTIRTLALAIQPEPQLAFPQETVTGSAPLLPVQHWFFEQNHAGHFNQALLLETPAAFTTAALRQIVGALFVRHDALRLTFSKVSGRWQAKHQVFDETKLASAIAEENLSQQAPNDLSAVLTARCNAAQASMQIGEGPLFKALHFHRGAHSHRLLLVCHHLVVDAVSWRIILADLGQAYRHFRDGKAIQLAPKTSSFQQWGQQLTAHANSDLLRDEADFWSQIGPVPPLPVDQTIENGADTFASTERVQLSLSPQETQALLTQCAKPYRTRISELLLAALVKAFSDWRGIQAIRVDMEGHGRQELLENLDLSQTVGWFTSMYPLTLTAAEPNDVGQLIQTVKEHLRAVPRQGIGYGIARYLGSNPAVQNNASPIAFNYLGRFDREEERDFRRAPESVGDSIALERPRTHQLGFNGSVRDKVLQFTIDYNADQFHRASMLGLAEAFEGALKDIIAHCLRPGVGCFTPADFPLARVHPKQLALWQSGLPGMVNLYPATAMQQGMLFHGANDRSAYVVQALYQLRFINRPELLREVWRQVIARHDILRTAFVGAGLDNTSSSHETPIHQLVVAMAEPAWRELDWSGLAGVDHEAAFKQLLDEDRLKGFDVKQPPLMRFCLIHLGKDNHRLLWSFHHGLLDGWCMPQLLDEVATIYTALAQGQTPQLPPAIPFHRYIKWLQNQDAQARHFWQAELAGFERPTPLVIDGRVSPASVPYGTCRSQLSAAVTLKLQDLVRTQRLTMNTLVQAAWALLLHRYSGENDVVFGTTVSGRPAELPGVEHMVGLFINSLPARVSLSDERQLVPWLQELRSVAMSRETYGTTPLLEIQACSALPAGMALFDSLVLYQNYRQPAAEPDRPGLIAIGGQEHTNYGITLVAGISQVLKLRFDYDATRFDTDAMQRMMGHLTTLLAGMSHGAAQTLAKLPMLSEAERHSLLHDWNQTEADVPDTCIHTLFEQQVAKTPTATALIYENSRLGYTELNERAGRLAAFLIETGVGPDDLIGLYMERCLEMVIAIYAILKAGAAYLPLDPDYPSERLTYMLSDANCGVVLTQTHLNRAHLSNNPVFIELDNPETRAILEQKPMMTSEHVASHHAAYVIYTSGSSGRPKGVLVEHRALVNRITWMQGEYPLEPVDRVLQKTPFSFDVSVWEFTWPMISGSCLVIAAAGGHKDPAYLVDLINRQRVTTLHFVPSMLTLMLNQGDFSTTTSIRQVFSSGEALPLELQQRFQACHQATLINLYGPTEAAIDVSHWVCRDSADQTVVPIGRPIANTQLYVLDKDLQPVPIGIPGELHIGGMGLARGYLNAEALTREKFIYSPFGTRAERLYKTGDSARWLPHGQLEFLGRIDFQVKLRGFRIELGEIEARLRQHDDLSEGVVCLREDQAGDPQLVAYTVTAGKRVPTAETLRAHLRAELPAYMIPAAFITLDALPLTANGKVDRKRLPPPAVENSAMASYTPPRDELEASLIDTWCTVLGHERIGVHDDFFELGGHSLKAMRLTAQLQKQQQVRLSPRDLFATPSVAALAEHIRTMTKTDYQPILCVKEADHYPVSHAQKGLWLLERSAQGAYNMPAAYHLDGPLDRHALLTAVALLVKRHKSLRTVFPTIAGEPAQQIKSVRETCDAFTYQDLSEHANPETLALAGAKDLAARTFDLETGPLFRLTLYKISEQRHLLAMSAHHIILDEWSLTVFYRELATCYVSCTTGARLPLQPMPIQYHDATAWHQARLDGSVGTAARAYWREKMAGDLPVLELLTDKTRPAQRTYVGNVFQDVWDQELYRALAQLGREHGVGLYVALQALFKLFLFKSTGQKDLIVGSVSAGREHPDLENQIGFYVNTLPLRDRLACNKPFISLLKQVGDTVKGALEHQCYPFDRIVEEVVTRRDHSHSPLFDVSCTLVRGRESGLTLGDGIQVSRLVPEHNISKLDLSCSFLARDGLVLDLEYNTDLFSPATIRGMCNHLKQLARSVCNSPQRTLSQLEMMSGAEKQTILTTWSRPESPIKPSQETVVSFFERQVAQDPSAIAVHYGDEHLDYWNLNILANRLAHQLLHYQVKADSLVGLLAEPSLELAVALLGILKAGAAYVPLDSEAPKARLAQMLADASPRIVVTQTHLQSRLPQDEPILLLDHLCEGPDENPLVETRPEHLAYVIYTSGSTGRPKGVVVPQRGLLTYARWRIKAYALATTDTSLQTFNVAFDAFAASFYPYLLSGGSVVLTDTRELDLNHMHQLIETHRVTHFIMVPSMYSALLDAAPAGQPCALRFVTVGAEMATEKMIATSRQQWPGVRLVNEYGPTETTISTAASFDMAPGEASLIGKPIAANCVYVLDEQMQPVPVGIPGQLHVTGDGMTRGYLNHAELTQLKFVDNPFSNEPGSRLYKTGDRVCWQADGRIKILGRIDHQVKLRGYRVELAEVEAVIGETGAYADVAVVVHEERLVAYLVPVNGSPKTVYALRHRLESQLPHYMVPAEVVFLDSMPRTVTGKLDRVALPRPALAGAATYAAPRNPIETALVSIWQEALGLETIGIYDDFFELGGYSLKAIAVTAAVYANLGRELGPRDLFSTPTIAGLAALLAGKQQKTYHPIEAVAEAPDYPLSHGQRRLWLLSRLDGGLQAYNMPAAWRLHGALDAHALMAAFAVLVERHQSLRTVFVRVKGEPRQKILAPEQVTQHFTTFDLSDQEDADAQALTIVKSSLNHSFNLEEGPLFLVNLLKTGPSEHHLQLNMHHIVSDEWSISVLLRELAALYQTLTTGQDHAPDDLPIQYKDYSAWYDRQLNSQVGEGDRCYWREKLAEPLPVLDLRTDWPRTAKQSFAGRQINVLLDPEVSAGLRRLGRERGVGLFVVVQALTKLLLYRYTAQNDMVVGSINAGRDHPSLDQQIGFFVQTFVLRDRLEGHESFHQLLDRVQETVLGAFEHPFYPFDKMVEESTAVRSAGRAPLFDVCCTLTRSDQIQIDLAEGLSLSPIRADHQVAKFDLSFMFAEIEDNSMLLCVEYMVNLFRHETVAAMVDHLQHLAHALLSEPDRAIAELEMMGHDEKRKVLDCNSQDKAYAYETCMQWHFEERAAACPNAPALVMQGRALNYDELNRSANRLAHHLIACGLQPDTLVGLCLERSPDMYISLLAILKAGGGFLPLDPDFPRARLAHVIDDSAAAMLISTSALLERLPGDGQHVLALDQCDLVDLPEHNPEPAIGGSNLAYVIYTSGSTGKPKGVLLEHRGLSAHCLAMADYYNLTAADHVLQFASMNVDIVMEQVFITWSCGAALYPRGSSLLSPEAFFRMVNENGITVADLPPAYCQGLFYEQNFWEHTSLHTVILGGEALPPVIVENWRDRGLFGRCRLINAYGPTETSIGSAVHPVSADDLGGAIPIGKANPHGNLYVLDPRQQPVPAGVVGQLFIGGIGLARGYLKRPGLTAKMFVPDPFAEAGGRLYKTGDLVCRRPDGNLDFMGRVDFQVKIRGFRIELGEIEARLNQHKDIAEAAVVVWEDGGKRIVAYVVPKKDSETEGLIDSLRISLEEHLPDYMMPSAFVALEALPLNPSDKIDRAALPAPDEEKGICNAPRDEREAILLQIWKQLLSLEQIDIHDNFFSLGGHSITAMRMISHIERELGVELQMTTLFKHSTIAELAVEIQSLQWAKASNEEDGEEAEEYTL